MNTMHKDTGSLPEINSMADLKKEIARLKASLRQQEADLVTRLEAVPKESLKVAAGAVLPAVVQRTVFKKSLRPVASLAGKFLFGGEKGRADLKSSASNIAKGLGIYTGLKMLYRLVKKKSAS